MGNLSELKSNIPISSQDRSNLTCQPHPVATEHLTAFQNQILPMEKAQHMAEFFSLLGDGNRLRILSVLAQQELCVCDLAAILNMSESAMSHQLRVLKSMGLVGYQKIGRKVFYRLKDHHVLELYRSVAEHFTGKKYEEFK